MLAAGAALAFLVAAAPFNEIPLARALSVIQIYQSALIANNFVTGLLLLAQLALARSRALLVLGLGYLFAGALALAHLLAAPGLLATAPGDGAALQQAAWLSLFWHAGFPLFVLAYAWLNRHPADALPARATRRSTIGLAVAAVLLLAYALALLALQTPLPALVSDGGDTPAMGAAVGVAALLTLLAAAALLRRGHWSVLNLCLLLVLAFWLLDLGLASAYNAGRFDLGSYRARIFGWLASSVVLLQLLRENFGLYFRLVGLQRRTRDELERANSLNRSHARERAQALDALDDKQTEIQAILEHLADCVVTTDEQGHIRSANRALLGTLGHDPAELIGQRLTVLLSAGDAATRDQAARAAAMLGIERLFYGRHRQGQRIPLEVVTAEYRLQDRRYFVHLLRDVRSRLQSASELDQARRAAEQATQAKSEFLASMSHEIRTPLNGVLGMIDVLHQTSLKGYQVEMVDLIRDSAHALLGVIDGVLDFSRIEAGALEVEIVPLPLVETIEKTGTMAGELARRDQVALRLFTDPALPSTVLGDAVRLRQVLTNLLSNAIKFSAGREQPGRVSLRVLLVGREARSATVELQVCDNGIGMAADAAQWLFTPFRQADASSTRRFGGSGLGLAITRRLVEMMGGTITVQTQLGQGSTFCVRLPFTLPAVEQTPALPPVAGLQCVVIADADGPGDDLATYLRHAGASVLQVRDFDEAAVRASELAPGLQVWIVAVAQAAPTAETLAALRAHRPGTDLRFVLLGNGRRRRPRLQSAEAVSLDQHVLLQRTFLQAVAVAAGRADEPEAAATAEAEAPGRQRPPSRREALAQGRLLLVAEDNATNRKVLAQQLQLLGYCADMEPDGEAALQHHGTGEHALLLTDLHMPRLDGYGLAQAIRRREAGGGRRLPIVALTADAQPADLQRCLDVGMDDYLTKPVPLDRLRALLERHLPAAAPTPPAGAPAPAAAPAQTLDIEVLKRIVGDDEGTVREILADFRSNAGKDAQLLRAACAAGEVGQAAAMAHKIKSSARSVGALALGALSADLETATDAAQLADRFARFDAELARVEAALDRALAPHDDKEMS